LAPFWRGHAKQEIIDSRDLEACHLSIEGSVRNNDVGEERVNEGECAIKRRTKVDEYDRQLPDDGGGGSRIRK
jgi:hypothetical protein